MQLFKNEKIIFQIKIEKKLGKGKSREPNNLQKRWKIQENHAIWGKSSTIY